VNAAGDGVKAVAVPTIRAVMAAANFIFDLLCVIIGEERREVVVWSRREMVVRKVAANFNFYVSFCTRTA
jgi:hypothetical protein